MSTWTLSSQLFYTIPEAGTSTFPEIPDMNMTLEMHLTLVAECREVFLRFDSPQTGEINI